MTEKNRKKKPWLTKSWKDQRKQRIQGQVCQQCGKKINLQVHHTHTDQHLYSIMEKRVIRDLIKKKMDRGEIPFQGIQVRYLICPFCHNRQKVPNPRYKNVTCKQCGQKQALSHENTEFMKKTNYYLGSTGIRIFIKKYQEEIEAMLKKRGAPPKPNYLDLSQDTVILCKTCHYALENGYELCPNCKQNYKKVQNLQCSQCQTN